MEIRCPECHAVYQIDVSKLSGKPTVRCGKCQCRFCIKLPESSQIEDVVPIALFIQEYQPKSKNPSNHVAERSNPLQEIVKKTKTLVTKESANEIINDFKEINFKEEVFPVDSMSILTIKNDFVFWSALILGIMPIFISTLNSRELQLTTFALFFASIWGLIFKRYIIENTDGWALPVIGFFFTGIIGSNLLLFIYNLLPDFSTLADLAEKNLIVSFFRYITLVGIPEELCKIFPVIAYLCWKRKNASVMMLILIGIFSGLGFAAFENMQYANTFAVAPLFKIIKYGHTDLRADIKDAMISVMLRSFSSVFSHAVWTGIFSYFIAIASIIKKRYTALFIIGLCMSSFAHGFYDWSCDIQIMLGALLTGFSFLLFYIYVIKLRGMVSE